MVASRTLTDAIAASAKTASAPAIIRGSVDISTYPGVTAGVLAGSSARQASGTALQAALDYCDTNGKYAEISPGRYEYEASATQNSRNTGLHVKKGVKGFVGGGSDSVYGVRLVQYASNHPALTIGDVGATASDLTEGGKFGGFAVGHGATQTGQTSADGLLLGRIFRSRFDDILVTPTLDGANQPYCGMRIGLGLSQFFFSNSMGKIFVKGGQAHIFRSDANGTGCYWENLYLGGVSTAGGAGTFSARLALSAEPVFINSPEFGNIGQLNIEWANSSTQTAALRVDNCDRLNIEGLHLEGNQLNNFDGRIMIATASRVRIATAKLLNNWIAAANATGTPCIVRAYSDSNILIDQMYCFWDGPGTNSEAVASTAFQLYRDDSTLVGRKPQINIRDFVASGHTGALSIDANTSGAAPGSAGAIQSFQSYQFNKSRSETDGATIEMRDAALTVYGQHRRCKVKMTATLTANRTLTLSDKMASAGAGSASVRAPGDILEVHRVGAGAFDLIVANQSASTLATFSGAGSAGTALSFEWSGSAWSAL